MGIANSNTIEAALEIRDEGSETFTHVASEARSAFSMISSHARSAGSVIVNAFQGAMNKATSLLSNIFSLRTAMMLLSGTGAIVLLERGLNALAERSEVLKQKFSGIKDAIGGFFGKLVDMIASNPALQRMLDDIIYKIGTWTYRLPDFEDKIRGVVDWVVNFVSGSLPQAFNSISNIFSQIWQKLKDFYAWTQTAWAKVDVFLTKAGSFFGSGGNVAGNPAAMLPDEMNPETWNMWTNTEGWVPYAKERVEGSGSGNWSAEGFRPFFAPGPLASNGTTVNNYFTQNMSRSDAAAIAMETERQAYRNA